MVKRIRIGGELPVVSCQLSIGSGKWFVAQKAGRSGLLMTTDR
ncbi:MAG: hypothetical protein ACM37W_08100 [Actinomycetota bacterium]